MNNNAKEKINKRTMVLIIILIMIYIVGFLVYPIISSGIKEMLTPNIQKNVM